MYYRVVIRLTCFHEVAVGGISAVAEDVVLDGVELRVVPEDERVTRARRAVVVHVSELDASVHEEAKRVRRQVHGTTTGTWNDDDRYMDSTMKSIQL